MEISDRRVNDVRATIEDRVLKLSLKAQQICASRCSANSIHVYLLFLFFFFFFHRSKGKKRLTIFPTYLPEVRIKYSKREKERTAFVPLTKSYICPTFRNVDDFFLSFFLFCKMKRHYCHRRCSTFRLVNRDRRPTICLERANRSRARCSPDRIISTRTVQASAEVRARVSRLTKVFLRPIKEKDWERGK